MGTILTLLAGPIVALVKAIAGVVRDKYDKSRELQFMKHEQEMAKEQRLLELTTLEQQQRTMISMEQVRKTDMWMRRTLFVVVYFPFIMAPFFPDVIRMYFENLKNALPEWYIMLSVGIAMAVFGIPTLTRWWGRNG